MARNDGAMQLVQWGLVAVLFVLFGPQLLASVTRTFKSLKGQFGQGAGAGDYISAGELASDVAAREAARAAGYLGPYSPEWYEDPLNIIRSAGGRYVGPYSIERYEEAAAAGEGV